MDICVDILWTLSTKFCFNLTLVRSLQLFLCCIIGLASDHFRVVCKHQCAVFFLINQPKFRVKSQCNAHRIGRKPLSIALNLVHVIGNDHFTDLPRKPAVGVDSHKAEHLVQHHIVCAVLLPHEKIHRIRPHKAVFEFQPVVSFSGSRMLSPPWHARIAG